MKKLHPDTLLIRTQSERSSHREHSVPMYLTSSFTFPTAEVMRDTFAKKTEGLIYARFDNPNVNEFIAKVCHIEGAEAGFATASGMAAVFASLAALLEAGDHILASRAVFGSTHKVLTQILPKWGITCTYVDPIDVDSWGDSVQDNTKMILVETPSNPGLQLVDLEKVGQLAAKHDLILNVDNCFATPYLQQPLQLGAHLVTHSGTKFMDGQGRVLGGIIAGRKELVEQVRTFCRSTGPSLSPFNAWTLSKSLETLSIRMDRHCSNALALAQFLEQHPRVQRVFYPHLPSHPQYELAKRQMKQGGGLVTFQLDGTVDDVLAMMNRLQLLSLTANLGDSRTIVTHPATTTHSKLTEVEQLAANITTNLVRVSVGLEHIDDIIWDINQALGGKI
ncbi:MAG: aminotransferase class I/II-fold pyridoxal phosphate-dependent enzyme [Bacteroidota bacterium]